MTYSNRPSSSPFQHRSEFAKVYKATDHLKMNPFLDNMPGTWSDPYPFAKAGGEDFLSVQDTIEKSPICDWGVSAGNNTVALCEPPFNFPKKESCPMSRPLVPMQLFEDGLWSLDKEHKKKSMQLSPLVILLLLLLVGLLIRFSKR